MTATRTRAIARPATLLVLAMLAASVAYAHETRPVYFELREQSPGNFEALLKVPEFGGAVLDVSPEFSGGANSATPTITREAEGAIVKTWTLHAPDLRGQTLRMRGLQGTITDALVRIEFADGAEWLKRFTPADPEARILSRMSAWELARVYVALGYEHILLGVDHLLFVLGLLLIVRGTKALIKTITAFTIAHSLTLAAATLGLASAPLPPLNAAIALSILFLGPEIARTWSGETSFTIENPWVVAFAFGLLHGFGFASGLSTAGMSRAAIPQALLWFNVGVELGQLTFVALVLAMLHAWRVLEMRWPLWAARAPGYAVGVCGAFWTIQRTVLIFSGR